MSGIATGTRLGSYRLDRRLGAGAVGEVYRARDLKLDRDVAIKVLRSELAADPERLRRFAREARAASALNHPAIVHIYDVGRHGEVPFLAMELIEGKTLRQLLADGPLAEADLLELAVQLVEGLAKAHAGGIVHRDLKPDNLMVSADGYLKILDFGLAKLWAGSGEDGAAVGRATQDGAVLGTAAYMSPEQAGGGAVDFRSDLFSVGAILYEMATGRPAFGGGSLAETLAAVIRARPEPLARLAPDMPGELGVVVARCLAKKPERRYATTQDLARELRALRDRARLTGTVDSDSYFAALDAHVRRRRRRLATIGVASLATIVIAVAAVVAALALWREPRPPELARSLAAGRLRLLAAATVPDGRPRDPDLSPDSKQFVFVDEIGGRTDLFLGRVAGVARVRLTDDAAIESHPDFSPDGERVAYTCLRPPRVEPDVCAVPTFGGRVAVLVEGASMPAWSPDGRRLAFVLRRPGETLAVAAADVETVLGGAADATDDAAAPRVLLAGDGTYPFLYRPAWSPDGRRLAVRRSVGGVAGEIWLVPAAGGTPRRLSRDPPGVFAHDPVWSADGAGVVVASNRAGATNLWLLGTDGAEPVRLTSGPGPDELPSVAANGTVAFLSTIWRYSLRLHDLENGAGSRELLSHNSYLWAPAFAPDGVTLAFSRAEADGAWHLWSVALMAGGELRQLTAGEAGEVYPRFLADGSLTFNTWSSPRRVLHLPASGGIPRTLDTGGPAAYADVSPDGRSLAFARQDGGEERIYVQPWDQPWDGGPARLLTASPATLPRWSPDGRWIAFSPDRSVSRGIFVIAADGSGERRLTATGGWPVWWPDGERIGYLDLRKGGDQEVRTVPFAGGPSAAVEGLRFVGTNHPFDVDPSGRFLAAANSAPVTSQIWLLEPAR